MKAGLERLTNPFQRLSHTDKENCYNSQWKEIEENNKKGTTRNIYQEVQEIKKKFETRIGMLNNQQGSQLTNQEKIKGR